MRQDTIKTPESKNPEQLSPLAAWLLGLGILMGFSALGGGIGKLLHLPVPGSVLGLVLLWLALSTGAVRLSWLEAAADHLLGVLGLLFVPATVGFIDYFSAGAAWGWWLLVMLAGLLCGASLTGVLASRWLKADQ